MSAAKIIAPEACRLVLYSGGELTENCTLDRELLRLSGKSKPSIAYWPSSSAYGRWEFGEFVHAFRRYGLSRFIYFPVDTPSTNALMEEAFSQDIIYLSGGNTFLFLHQLRKRRLLARLREFALRGGVLAGLSAGAILMTPSIETAGFPDFDRDENAVGIHDLESLALVNFEFYPHFANSARYRDALTAHARGRKIPLYACPDGSGLVVESGGIHVCGKARVFLGNRNAWRR